LYPTPVTFMRMAEHHLLRIFFRGTALIIAGR
jgi:hypothetical protein